ncbi:AP-1 adaptor complex mu subunit Apm1 [Sporothrix stenoceras]
MPTLYKLEAVTVDDVPVLARMSADAFKTDRQTQMKALGKERPFDMEQYTLQALPDMLTSPRCVMLKVVDTETNNIMGYCNWGFHGFAPEEMPVVEGRTTRKVTEPPKPAKADNAPKPDDAPSTDPVKRLEALTGGDMQAWMDEVMPANTPKGLPKVRCLFVIGLIVASEYQGRGVGSALIEWGTDLCDAHGVFAWVHSSEPAWKMYAKCGFEVIRSLDVNLDEYAPSKKALGLFGAIMFFGI